MSLLMFVAATALQGPEAPQPAEIVARVAQAPKDVAKFIERRAGCNHFLGEEPYDAARAAEIDEALRELRCRDVAHHERILRKAYRGDPAIQRLIDETANLLAW